MKSDIHPDYHTITVKMTNGETFETRSTYGKEGDVLQLDIDRHTHPAWVGGGAYINEKAGKVARFNERFGGISLKKKEAEPVAEQPKAEKPAAKPEGTAQTAPAAEAEAAPEGSEQEESAS